MSTLGSHSCTSCGAPTEEARCDHRLLLRLEGHHLPLRTPQRSCGAGEPISALNCVRRQGCA